MECDEKLLLQDEEPMVSIITVCKNSSCTIRQTIESVLNQTYRNIEYLVVDGVSTDGTIDILREFKIIQPERFSYISESDKGLYHAMNKGIDMAKGSIVGIINSDDFYAPNAVELVVEAWRRNGRPDLITGITSILDEQSVAGKCIATPLVDEKMNLFSIPHPSTFIAKNAYSKFGKFNTDFVYAADRELLIRHAKLSQNYIFLNDVLAYFRQGGLGARIGITAQIENFHIDRKYIGLLPATINFIKYSAYSMYKKYFS